MRFKWFLFKWGDFVGSSRKMFSCVEAGKGSAKKGLEFMVLIFP